MSEKLNIYQKLNKARQMLCECNLKKTGSMQISNRKYAYFELSDIQPSIVKICNELNLFLSFNFGSETSSLDVIDCEDTSSKITFTQNHENFRINESRHGNYLQALGSKSTYLTRYLLMPAFMISEDDSTELIAQTKQQSNIISKEQQEANKKALEINKIRAEIDNILNERNITDKKEYLQLKYPDLLMKKDYKSILEELKNE
jgi:hypothetical protein